jgi:ribonucleoside-diphosphate reductase alpha chain
MQVTKRNGNKEDFDLDKIHKVISWAIDGIEEVSLSDIEMNSKLKLYDGITTAEIHDVLIRSASDLISLECPNYQYVAARLSLYSLRKEVWGSDKPPRLYEHIKSMVKLGYYDPIILENYTKTEILKLDKVINHDRDNLFTYAGLQQMIDKYLVKNRHSGEIFETPQFVYMLISMATYANYSPSTRIEYVKKTYNALSNFKISLATPVLAGLRTTSKQFSSCILVDVDDSLDSIFSSASAIGQYVAKRAGIGTNVGRIRSIGESVRGGDVVHTGLIPFLKLFQSVVSSCSQGGIRKGSATVNVPFFHPEIEDTVVLK